MTALATRIALAAIAVAVIAWLAISFHNEQRLADVSRAAAKPNPSQAEIEEGLRLLDESYPLNPDSTKIETLRAALDVRAVLLAGGKVGGPFPRAAAAMERVVEREPENAEAWALLATFTQQSDPERSAEARARVAELDPAGEEVRRQAR